ncbi:cyclic AMP-dependent transcription factor ATF-2 [Cephus cinctus]|uniref:Cyclic AMP-dependent transcription factor ATF-2 n=1 Tax=Cephus cinctus TaxID=211228 RepID=A0AAJ7BPS9_CEPCN|nr:cyclic AMP-dependent transcription factor ATF-2 [Cephus cinctus]
MTDSEKPFACPSPGCNMSFTNEDHLMVHKKKHDMVLNLGANGKNNVFVADQTPTPTRFIRNCEEVGLFQDLQNVNPFEETFRRAVEAGKSGSLTVPEVGISDDTLHTPHVFPHISDVQQTNDQILAENVSQETPSITITEIATNQEKNTCIEVCTSRAIKQTDSKEIKNVEIITTKEHTGHSAETIIVQETDTSITTKIIQAPTSPQLSINGEEVQLLLKTADGKLMQLSAIPVSEPCNNSTTSIQQTKASTVVIKTEPPLRSANKNESKSTTSSRLSLAKMKLKQVLTKNGVNSDNPKSIHSEDDFDDLATTSDNQNRNIDPHKKKEILERNRASSMRARAKRKAWIQQLERTVNNVNETNAVLQMEVRALRSEVAKLKTLLLAHKDCPVTKAMEKGNGIIVGPKVISINPEMIQAIPVSSSVNVPIKRTAASPEVSIAPKKKLSFAGTVSKNPVILPKSDNTLGSAKIVRNLSALKIVEVGHFLNEKERGKQILIVQNPSGKIVEASPRPIVQINPSFEIQNAASKSTGT